MIDRPSASLDDLAAVLARLDRILARAVERVAHVLGTDAAGDPFRGLYISDHDARRLLETSRWSPLLGVAADEPPVSEVVDPASPLAALAGAYGLSAFDVDVVVVALAAEVDLAYGRLYAFLQDDVSRRRPSVDLVLSLLCATAEAKVARREHFSSDAPLVANDVIELVADPAVPSGPLLGQFVRLDDAVTRLLLGQGGLDPRLHRDAALVEPPADGEADAALEPELAGLERLVADARASGMPLRLWFSGPADGRKRRAAEEVAAAAGAPLLAIALDGLYDGAGAAACRMLLRHAALRGAIAYLEPVDALAALQPLEAALSGHPGAVVLAGTAATPPRGRGLEGIVELAFPMPDHDERRGCWDLALGDAGVALPADDVEALAGRFRLTPDQIADAVQAACTAARWRAPDGTPSLADLFDSARSRSDAALAGVARKVTPVHGWQHIALPGDSLAQLREMCQQVAGRHRVLDDWGFGRRLSLGKGVSALFAGPSGTGKTTAADIIAGELGLDLYKVDLSGVVSKYIGETEKNLSRIFAAAENANAILFFDEADALFGKRSEVRDSHDRYANVETAHLLQQMEQYEGVAILATNLRQNLDDAFVRRLQFVVEFPFPDEAQRARIWRLLFPDEAERDDDIDFDLLARQFRITGGSIKNVVLAAAFLAAADGRPIGTEHILRATRREYHKTGKVLADADVAPYRELVAG